MELYKKVVISVVGIFLCATITPNVSCISQTLTIDLRYFVVLIFCSSLSPVKAAAIGFVGYSIHHFIFENAACMPGCVSNIVVICVILAVSFNLARQNPDYAIYYVAIGVFSAAAIGPFMIKNIVDSIVLRQSFIISLANNAHINNVAYRSLIFGCLLYCIFANVTDRIHFIHRKL